MEDNGDQLLQNRFKNNFEIVNDDGIVVEKPFVNTDSVNKTKNDVFNKQGSTLDTIFNELRSHLNHILILNLEFYQDTKENHARMLQIAGIVLGRNSKSPSFNGFMQNEQKGKEKERTIPPHLLMRGCIRSCSFFIALYTLMV